MMTRKVTVLAGVLTLAGCVTPYGEAPVAKNFPTTSQEKLQAASHWNVVSKDISTKIQAQISEKVDKNQALFVMVKTNSPFNNAVAGELISSLVAGGYTVVNSSANALKVEVDTQVLKFSPNRLQSKQVGIPTAIATGIWFLAEIGTNFSAAGVATGAIAGSEAYDYFNSNRASGVTPQSEIIVNVSVMNATKYLAVTRGTYYVADSDSALYRSALETKSFSVRGGD